MSSSFHVVTDRVATAPRRNLSLESEGMREKEREPRTNATKRSPTTRAIRKGIIARAAGSMVVRMTHRQYRNHAHRRTEDPRPIAMRIVMP